MISRTSAKSFRHRLPCSVLRIGPKWMTDQAQGDNVAKACKQVDDWAVRTAAMGFSGGVTVVHEPSGMMPFVGDLRDPKERERATAEFRVVGDPEMAAKVIGAAEKTSDETIQGLCWTCRNPVTFGIRCEKCGASTDLAGASGLTGFGLATLKEEGSLVPYDSSCPPTTWIRGPRYPWLRWLFNLISTEEAS